MKSRRFFETLRNVNTMTIAALEAERDSDRTSWTGDDPEPYVLVWLLTCEPKGKRYQ